MPFATGPPTDLEPLRNLTAAAVSLHFGYTVFVVGVALSLWPRSPLAWASVLYPALIFVVIVGTGNHYVLDAVVGAACVGLAFAAARRIHGRQPRAGTDPAPASARTAALVGLGVALVGLAANGVATGSLRPGV
jgi:PAP2 superfamily